MIGSGHLTLTPTRIITEFIFILQCGYWLKVGIMFIPNTTLWWIVLTQFPRLNHHTVCTEVSRQWNQTTLKCVIMSYLNKLKYDRQFQFTEIALVFVLRLCWVTTLLCGVYSNCYWVNVGPVCTTQMSGDPAKIYDMQSQHWFRRKFPVTQLYRPDLPAQGDLSGLICRQGGLGGS